MINTTDLLAIAVTVDISVTLWEDTVVVHRADPDGPLEPWRPAPLRWPF